MTPRASLQEVERLLLARCKRHRERAVRFHQNADWTRLGCYEDALKLVQDTLAQPEFSELRPWNQVPEAERLSLGGEGQSLTPEQWQLLEFVGDNRIPDRQLRQLPQSETALYGLVKARLLDWYGTPAQYWYLTSRGKAVLYPDGRVRYPHPAQAEQLSLGGSGERD